jgi:hypothetical protein
MTFLEDLRKGDPSSPVAFHLEGLLAAQDNIRSLLATLAPVDALDRESTAEALTHLQEEIYQHLAYHVKELRRPLRRLVDKAYKDLSPIDVEAEVARLERLR